MSSAGSFAAAQERILARQEARRQEAQTAYAAQQQALRSSTLGRLPYPFNRAASPLTSFWHTLLNSEGTKSAVRVGQVDAELLDEELLVLLKSQIGDALKYFNPHIQDDYSHEILLALRAILFKLSIWDNNASYGAALQGLRYTDARQTSKSNNLTIAKPTVIQKSLYGLITVLGRYGWDKYSDYLVDAESSYTGPTPALRTLSSVTARLSTFHNIASLTSFLIFLTNGRYRTLTDRLLRLRLISPNAQTHREVSFEYLNRQLVWHAFTEFLLFLLPLVGISRWRRWVSRAWRNTKRALSADTSEDNSLKEKRGPLAFLPERTCAICYQDQNPTSTSEAEVLGANTGAGGGIIGSAATDVVNPYETIPCQCIYCFVCIASKIEGEEGGGWTCLRCGETVYRCRPWRGDVLVERPKDQPSGNKKSVGFVDDADIEVSDAGDSNGEEEHENHAEPIELDSELGSSQWQLESDRSREFMT
ncbi:peroxisome assembly protein (Peroxin-2) [Neophaeococcomyces mojaviensis]|uniref:Peroxisome assembly protein (Peroxin-2) n=1 Tax=Neophaeococcomyces mojaviensis TaxID=3383035 RepID=A0ACC3ABE4_9EURO|nr:peroxisome assembly protein (Peroxin-2) [Knufia sp. JES_112]